MSIGLSPSSLASFKNCPRCFWWEKNRKVPQPEGIKASLPKGFDELMKAYVNGIVEAGGQVPWLTGIPGAAPFRDRTKLKKFMKWQTFQAEFTHKGVALKAWGNVDDVIEHTDGMLTPWDFKTKAKEPAQDYGEKYYQTQLDMYALIFEGLGYVCSGAGILTYGWPLMIDQTGDVRFGWKNLTLKTDPSRALDLMVEAAECLAGPEPEAGSCEYCRFVENRK